MGKYLREFIGNKHVIIKDSHGQVEHIKFLTFLVTTLQSSHKTLFFEPLVEGCRVIPETQISSFLAVFGHLVAKSYINEYSIIKKLINVLPGDFLDTQPENHPDIRNYYSARYKMNKRIGKKIKLCKFPTISFYGQEHGVSRPYDWAKGIPDYLNPDTFVVLEFIKHPLPRYLFDSKKETMVNIATIQREQLKSDKICDYSIIHSELDIDWPNLFIIQHVGNG